MLFFLNPMDDLHEISIETAGFHREKRAAAPRKRAGAASDVPLKLFRGGAGSHGSKRHQKW